jgi:hypothetical protein
MEANPVYDIDREFEVEADGKKKAPGSSERG